MTDPACSPEDEVGGGSERSRVRRLPELARYDRESVYEILDAASVCSVGVLVDGAPLVLTTLFCRDGDHLLFHGSRSSLLLRSMLATPQVCVSVTLLDGVIVARSAFNSSMAHRSVVLFGAAERVVEPDAIERALDLLTEAVIPGRVDEIRRPTPMELNLTGVVRVRIEEASAKVSLGPPQDDPEDLATEVWAGLVPSSRLYGLPIPAEDGHMSSGTIDVPPSVWRLVATESF